MGTSRIQEAVGRYERIVKQAASDYEDALKAAESDLRNALVSSDVSEPPDSGMVSMTRSDYEQLQEQLNRVASFIEAHPELK